MNNSAPDLPPASVNELLEQLLQHHHPYTKAALNELAPLLEQVVRVQGAHYPELEQLAPLVRQLRSDMEMHLWKEENILFPYLRQLDGAGPIAPPPFGTVINPVRMMRAEHDTDHALLQQMREVTRNFAVPENASPGFTALYQGLQVLVEDLLQHMDLENNHLFPLVIELEQDRQARA